MQKILNKGGGLLIFSIWVMLFLAIFATHVGMRVRQRIALLSRVEHNSQLRFIAEAGIKLAVAALKKDVAKNVTQYTSYGKYYRHNNPDVFSRISLDPGFAVVSYGLSQEDAEAEGRRYGFVDEERKINVNVADLFVMARLIETVTGFPQDKSRSLASAIVDWREPGETEMTGFYSDQYYDNLEYPYSSKGSEFEVLDELLLVRGITPEVYNRLRPFMTIYGDGQVNINTAPREVLLALGLDASVADKLIKIRRGYDEIEDTVDDFIFNKSYDVASEILSFTELEIDEIKQIDGLNDQKLIKTNSYYYSIISEGYLDRRKESKKVECVLNVRNNKIVYWKEK